MAVGIKPPISLQVEIANSIPIGFVNNPSATFDGVPFQYAVKLNPTPQVHGYFDISAIPAIFGGYDQNHIEVGDWVAINPNTATQIIAITSVGSNDIDVVAEDIGFYNITASPFNEGMPATGTGFIFRVDDENKAVIVPDVNGVLTPEGRSDINNRFQYTSSAQPAGFNWINANEGIDFTVPAVATSSNAIAIGNAAKALNENAISIGSSAENSGANSILIGDGLTVTEDNSIALGNNGQIKFYINEAGDTGFGTDNPEAKLDLYTSARNNYLKISNNVTGTSADSGVLIGLESNSNNLRFVNQENADLTLETAGFERIKIDTSGYINFIHGNFNTMGDASYKFAILKATTVTSGVETWLTLPNNDELDMPDNSTWLFEADVLGKQEGGVIVGGYRHRGLITRSSGASSVLFVEAPYAELIGESVSAYGWESGVSADPSTGGLRIFGKVSAFSLPGQINWFAMVKITEINF